MAATPSIPELVKRPISAVYGLIFDVAQLESQIESVISLVEGTQREAEDSVKNLLPEDSRRRVLANKIFSLLSLSQTNKAQFQRTMETMINEHLRKEDPEICKLPEAIIRHFVNIMQLVTDNTDVWLGAEESLARKPNQIRMLCETALRRITYWPRIVPSILILSNLHKPRNRHDSLSAFSRVYKEEWMGQQVAMKILHTPNSDTERQIEKQAKLFLREMVVWRQLSHPNIVPLLGIPEWYNGLQDEYRFCMVSPWAQNGSLSKLLNADQPLDPLPTVTKVADALSYLHVAHKPPMAHGDIHPGNVLIGLNGEPLLTDFGLSRFHGNYTTTRTNGAKGFVQYQAPEMLASQENWTPRIESDMYAFGSLCFQVYTRRQPWGTVPGPYVVASVLDKERPDRPSGDNEAMPDEIWNIIDSCWKHEPSERKISTDAWRTLKGLHRS